MIDQNHLDVATFLADYVRFYGGEQEEVEALRHFRAILEEKGIPVPQAIKFAAASKPESLIVQAAKQSSSDEGMEDAIALVRLVVASPAPDEPMPEPPPSWRWLMSKWLRRNDIGSILEIVALVAIDMDCMPVDVAELPRLELPSAWTLREAKIITIGEKYAV